jgi:hypothetical protein
MSMSKKQKRDEVFILITEFKKKPRERFKKNKKALLRESGIHTQNDYLKGVIYAAMANPTKFIPIAKRMLKLQKAM